MRLKARSLGLMAEDYTTDTIEDVNHIYPGNRLIENVSSEEIDMIYNKDGVGLSNLESIQKPVPNENYILRNGQKSVLAYFDPFEKKITQINNLNAYGITPRNAEQSFALNMLLDERIHLITLSGKAGTGKTLLALACALERRKSLENFSCQTNCTTKQQRPWILTWRYSFKVRSIHATTL